MLPVLPVVISLIALSAAKLDPRLAFGLFVIAAVIYSDREDLKLGIRNVDDRTSYFNVILFASILAALAVFFIPRDVAYASAFVILAHEFRRGALWNINIYSLLAMVYFTIFDILNGIPLNIPYLFFLSLAGGLSASLVESVDSDADKRLTVMIAAATVFTIFRIYVPTASLTDLAVAFLIAFILSLFALKAGVADESGLMSATIVGTSMILFTDIRFFAIIATFYIVGSAVTKYKYEVKQRLGIAETAGGARGYSNVFGNSLAPLFFALQYGTTKEEIFAVAFVASVATALGDTMASEVGKTAKNVYLITNFNRVEPGVSGGISYIGELSAIAGAALISLVSVALGIIEIKYLALATIAAFLAIHVDSVLGATLEEKGYLNNSSVNFIATLSSGVFCYLLL
jgi:uncharacterized protein (TIGR00297 family)